MTTWDQALDEFAAYMRRERRRYSTIKSHRSHLQTLALRTPDGPWTVRPDDVEAWLESRGASRRNGWAVARVFYAWARRCGYVMDSPVPPASPGRRAADVVRDEESLPVAWRDPLAEYASWMQAAGRAARTMVVHMTYLRRFARTTPDPWTVTGLDIARWAASHDWKPETRKSALVALRGFYGRAVRSGVLVESPAEHLDSVRVPRAFPRPVGQEALTEALERACDRDRLMIVLAAYAGLRAREIAAVRPSTDVQDGFLYVVGKGGNERRIPLHPLLAAELEEETDRRRAGSHGSGFRYVGELDPDGYLFPSTGGGHVTPGCVTERLSSVLPGRWTGHTLRHRFASSAYAVTKDLRAVQELLGHASPQTTARYTATPDTALRAAVWGIQ